MTFLVDDPDSHGAHLVTDVRAVPSESAYLCPSGEMSEYVAEASKILTMIAVTSETI